LVPVIKVDGSLLKPLELLYESRLENYLFFFRKWLRSKLGVTKDFRKEVAYNAYLYVCKKLSRYLLNFLTMPLTLTREYVGILKSSRKTDWRALVLMRKIYEKHVAEYVKLFTKALASSNLRSR